MTRQVHPLAIADLSAFARNLRKQLADRHRAGLPPPGQQEMLNLLSRAAGLRNFQTLAAVAPATPPATTPAEAPATARATASAAVPAAAAAAELTPAASKALTQFDAAGRLLRLPSKLSVQQTAMWWLWTRFALLRKYTERDVNRILNAHHHFGDPATLRREMVEMKLLGRKSDCSEYWKEPARPAPEIAAFLRALRGAIAA